MSIEMKSPNSTSRNYQITVEGKIDASWSVWLAGMQLVSRKNVDGMVVTSLSGILTDQAGLRGLLNRLWDLNLVLRSVRQVDVDNLINIE